MAEEAEQLKLEVNVPEEEDILPLEEPVEKTDDATKDENSMEVEVTKNATAVNTGWVDILEKENNMKLMSELNKIGKLISTQDKARDIQAQGQKHRVIIYPVYPQDLVDPYIIEVMQKCVYTNVQFQSVIDDGQMQIKGLLDLKFTKYSDLVANKEKLGKLRDDIQISNTTVKYESDNFISQWKTSANIPERNDLDDLTLFAPSLPESVTDDEMWELFPLARQIILVPGAPRQHAFVKFTQEAILQRAIEDLKTRGPPRPDFNFCRLVRYSKISAILREDKKNKKKSNGAPGSATSPARPIARGRRRRVRQPSDAQASTSKPDEAKPKADPKSAPQDKAKVKPAAKNAQKSTGQTKKAKPRANQQQAPRTPARPRNTSNTSWYSERRAMHLDRARNPVRAGQQSSRGMMDTNPGIQMLGSLLTSLGRLSSGSQYTFGQANNTQAMPPPSQPRRNRRKRGGAAAGSNGDQRRSLPDNQQGQSRGGLSRGDPSRGGPPSQGGASRGGQSRGGRRRGGQQRQQDDRQSPNYGGMRTSPSKRAHSQEDMNRWRDVSNEGPKRRRRNRNRRDSYGQDRSLQDSYQQDSSQTSSSMMYRGDYDTPRRSSTGSSYTTPVYNRSGYDSYSSSQSTSTPIDRLTMLDALTKLSRQSGSNRSTSSSNRFDAPLSSTNYNPSYY